MSDNRGYTAIELMMVMAVVAITSSLAVANHASKLPQTNLRGASRDIVAELRRARQQAIRTRSTIVVCFPNTDDVSCEDIPEGNFGVPALREAGAFLQKTLPRYVSFGSSEWLQTPGGGEPPDDGVSFGQKSAAFNLDGRSNGGTGTIYLTNVGSSGISGQGPVFDENVAISINITGRVKLQTCKKIWNEDEDTHECDWQ